MPLNGTIACVNLKEKADRYLYMQVPQLPNSLLETYSEKMNLNFQKSSSDEKLVFNMFCKMT